VSGAGGPAAGHALHALGIAGYSRIAMKKHLFLYVMSIGALAIAVPAIGSDPKDPRPRVDCAPSRKATVRAKTPTQTNMNFFAIFVPPQKHEIAH
jgi:hypothetical protein